MSKYLLSLSFFFCLLSSAPGGIIQVPQDQPGIQAGINAAFPGDTVLVADSTYYENIDFKGKAITVASHFSIDGDTTHINNTIIDGSKPSDKDDGSVVYFVSGEDTTSVLYGFTITGGSGTYYAPWSARIGGGVYCFNSGCKIITNKIINNSVTGPSVYGGGLAAIPVGSNAWVVLKYNQITHNTATANTNQVYGGGVLLFCHARIDSNSISYNTCTTNTTGYNTINGGGIFCASDPPYPLEIIMENNTVTHNSLRINGNPGDGPIAYGGGVFIQLCNGRMSGNEISYNEIWDYSNWGAVAMGASVGHSPDSLIIEGNIIRGNVYKHGTGDSYAGGLQVFGTDVVSVINNLIEGNSATYGGGVLINHFINPCTVVMVNNTIINNNATNGGGIRVGPEATAYIMNTIIWGNQAPTNAAIQNVNSTIYVAYSDVQGGWTGTGNINEDPKLTGPYFYLSDDSPCIDKGNPDVAYNDPEDSNNPGFALAPAKGTVRNDMGAFGGPGAGETITAIKHERSNIEAQPNTFALFQNYPNPFNPSTTIEFTLPKSSFVALKVYDLLGREVATLVADKLVAGRHKYDWIAKGLASGVYCYRLQAGEFMQTKKLILLR
jgi:hypothetical protein